MVEAMNEIKNHVEDARESLNSNLRKFGSEAKSAADWKRHYAKRPGAMIGVAFGAGVLLAALLSRKKHIPTPRLPAGMQRQKQKAADTLGTIKDALAGVAAARLKALVSDVIPCFQEHYARVKRERSAMSPQSST